MTEPMIIKSSGGFYYIDTPSGVVECRARGLFRKEGITPYVGDRVEWEQTDGNKGYITKILERRNHLIRPPVANIDQLVMVIAVIDPPPNLLVIDKLLAVAEYKGISPLIVITKCDLADGFPLLELYRKVGYRVVAVSSLQEHPEALKPHLKDQLSVFTGNTGVGKSTLLNALEPSLNLATGEISKKLGRGRHTTRTTEIYKLCDGMIADTPGFTSLETIQLERILKDQLEDCFIEFGEYIGSCRFTGCSHTKEKGCAVIEAVQAGAIIQSRYESYLSMYEDAKNIKEWELDSQSR